MVRSGSLRVIVVATVIVAGCSGGGPSASKPPAPTATSPRPAARSGSPCGHGAGAPGNCLVAVSFLDATHGFGVYAPQTATAALPLEIVKTADAGSSWQVVGPVPTASPQSLAAWPHLFFIDPDDGFLSGGPGFSVTHDGGRTWTPVNTPGSVLAVVRAGSGIWAAYSSCTVSDPATSPCGAGLEATSDAGRSWRKVAIPASRYISVQLAAGIGGPVFVALTNPPGSLAASPGVLLVSADGGESWSSHRLPCPPGYRLGATLSVSGSPDTVWLVCGGQGSGGSTGVVIYRSADKGDSWIPESSYQLGQTTGVRGGAPGGKLEELVSLSGTNALALTVNDGLLQTSDGGVTWSRSGPTAMRNDIGGFQGRLDVADATHFWVAAWITVPGPRGLWKTSDGGETWKAVSPAG